MITTDRMARVDANAEALGVPRKQLMESSGNAVARVVRAETDPDERVVILAGRGNNGGDALVAARFLDDRDGRTYLLGRRETIATDIARENFDALRTAEYDVREVRDSTALDMPDADLVVDGLLGTGVRGSPREPAASTIRAINRTDAFVVAVDVPSGLDADTGDAPGAVVEADRVVTFHDTKPGLVDLDAPVTVADIGIPETAKLFVERGDLLSLSRSSDAHKGENGEVLVIGGGPYTGAPALSARAALRAGADLARVACPASVAREVQGYSESLIVRGLSGDHLAPVHVDGLLDLSDGHDAVVVGPGIGDAEPAVTAVEEFLEAFGGRAVVDADALSVVPGLDTDADLVCTPHRGELRKMGGPVADDWRKRVDAIAEFAANLGRTLLVKGPYDVISDGATTRVNRTGNPGMTVGGTGDVLAGAVGALVGVLDPVQAAALAAYANGRAGDRAVGTGDRIDPDPDDYGVGGYGILPTDVIDRLPGALWGDRP